MKRFNILPLLTGFALLMYSCNDSAGNETKSPDQVPAVQTADAGGQVNVVDDVSQKDIVKIAVGSPDHTTLVKAVQAADLVNVLSNAGPFTVFAPTNAAFEALPPGTLDELLKPENKQKLADILQYHVTISTYDGEKLTDGKILNEVSLGSVKITNKDGKIMVNDATIIASVPASNGIVHIIDKVLLPK